MSGYSPPSFEPLMISPQMQAHAAANANPPQQQQPLPPLGGGAPAPPPPPPVAPAAPPGGGENLEMLVGMFPDMDKGVLQIILGDANNNVEEAVNQLLQMTGDPSAGGVDPDVAAASAAADEELAQALMMQFAMDFEAETGEEIPPEIRADPARFDAFVRQRFDQYITARPNAVDSLMSRTVENNDQLRARAAGNSGSGGKTGFQGFMTRLKNGVVKTTTTPIQATSTRVKVVAVGSQGRDDKRTSLLSDQDTTADRM